MKTYLLILFPLLAMPWAPWSRILKPDSTANHPRAGFSALTPQHPPATSTASESRWRNSTAAGDTLSGEIVYKQYCLSCHQANGSGVPKLNPPLKGTDWVLGDKTRLINVILKGLQNVDIEDEPYDNVMPAHDFLTDQQIADVLTYVRSHFGNQASAIAPDEVKTTRAMAGK